MVIHGAVYAKNSNKKTKQIHHEKKLRGGQTTEQEKTSDSSKLGETSFNPQLFVAVFVGQFVWFN